jgi:hypothetical protein
MYLWDAPFLILGILFLLRRREGFWWILPLWLLIGIIPAAVARETPHALRIESTLPTWQILSAYGFVTALTFFKRFKMLFGTIAAGLLLISVGYFIHGYYVHYATQYAQVWQYGYKDIVLYVKTNETKYDQVYISNAMERPYIYMLFYLKYDPKQFRKEAKIRGNDYGFVHVDSFGKYFFVNNPETISSNGKKVLYITDTQHAPKNVKIVQTFHAISGDYNMVAFTKDK